MKKILLLIAFMFTHVAFATDEEVTGEGFDRQTPEEIEFARRAVERDFANAVQPMFLSPYTRATTLARYSHLDPNQWVPSDLLEEAVLYYDANLAGFPNQKYITIVDFKPRSSRYRFFLIDMATGAVERYHTTHGVGSDRNNDGYAEQFNNTPNSGASSLGFARTAEIYWGKFKRSVRLDGLSTTNSRIRQRAIVFHGWDKVHERDVIQGRSWGCITLDWAVKDAVLDKIAEGSLMYSGVSK